MKTLVLAFSLAMITAASAQLTTTRHNSNGEPIGTATTKGNIVYIRDLNGELTGTITLGNPMTIRDHNGNILETLTSEGNTATIRDAEGKTIRTAIKNKDGTMTTRDANGEIIVQTSKLPKPE